MKSLAKIILATFTLGIVSLPCYADTVTKATTTITLRTNAPIYMGHVQETELQELTLQDFQQIAADPTSAERLYNEYQKELKQLKPNPNLVPYKIKIENRDLTLADFQGGIVSRELAQARYQEYLRSTPMEAGEDGQNVRYVYVYHTPITRAV
ncbi:MAG: hypothetical protein WC530_00985 [Candidatus Omnitrophota bacterium]